MQKRAGLARAMALSPEVLLFDEPSAGLDPISSRLLDDLILELRNSLGATIVMVTHELSSIFTVGDNSVFLDAETKTQIALGDPKRLLDGMSKSKSATISQARRACWGALDVRGVTRERPGSHQHEPPRPIPNLSGASSSAAIGLASGSGSGLWRFQLVPADA